MYPYGVISEMAEAMNKFLSWNVTISQSASSVHEKKDSVENDSQLPWVSMIYG